MQINKLPRHAHSNSTSLRRKLQKFVFEEILERRAIKIKMFLGNFQWNYEDVDKQNLCAWLTARIKANRRNENP